MRSRVFHVALVVVLQGNSNGVGDVRVGGGGAGGSVRSTASGSGGGDGCARRECLSFDASVETQGCASDSCSAGGQ